ncbi:MAG: DNA translocase FtsK 4TM domain-containing protein [Rickettsiaceae bacterium]|nr:DNA translocase FtsK 4TM domain-containing protein [Rickettsiaceae bacterium]
MLNQIFANRFLKASLLFGWCFIVLTSLISYSEHDSSFNTASPYEPNNLMSYFGSYFADIVIQSSGKFGWLILVCNLILSVNIIKNNLKKIIFRIICSFACSILLALLFSVLISPAYVGSCKYLSLIILNEPLFSQVIIISLLSLLFVFLLLYSSGTQIKDLYSIVASCIYLVRLKKNNQESFNIRKEPTIFGKLSNNASKPSNQISTGLKQTKIKNEYAHTQTSNSDYTLPNEDLLNQTKASNITKLGYSELQTLSQELLGVLNDFGVKGAIGQINQGPVVTLYEFEPSAGTKSSRVISLSDDVARSLSALSARIAVIPGRNALGIELPNHTREFFRLRELIESKEYHDRSIGLPIILGKDIAGKPTIVDLAKMPHLLVAGTTGSGKSVAINTMILSLLFRHSPDDCRFIMIDPKMLELSVYDGIPHLLAPVVTDSSKAVVALKWAVREMENRYKLMSNLGVRNIHGYNQRISQAIEKKEELKRTVQTGFDVDTGKPIYESIGVDMKRLPFIVVIVDEMADLMLVAGKDIESSIQRLAQMARAAGIHLIMATQRPSVDVITGVIKANFPSRISFKVTSKIDSRTILGEQGAEQLLGMGDMLYMGNSSKIIRVHGPFVEDLEVERISNFLKAQGTPDYIEAVTSSNEDSEVGMDSSILENDTSDENLYKKAVNIVKNDGKCSTSYVQRVLRIGYNRAALLIEKMEKEGIISAPNHSGKREILIKQ